VQLTKNGHLVRLQHKPFELLCLLAQNAGKRGAAPTRQKLSGFAEPQKV